MTGRQEDGLKERQDFVQREDDRRNQYDYRPTEPGDTGQQVNYTGNGGDLVFVHP